MTKPFRFGVQSFITTGRADWTEQVKTSEDLGYSAFVLADHYLGPGPALDKAAHPIQSVAAIPAMMAAAAVTDTIKVGCKVLCIDYHHPVVLAKELATIDYLSDGRLEVGLGAGWTTAEYEALGIKKDRAGIRIDRLEEVINLVRAFLAGEKLDFHGEHVTAFDFEAVPAAVQPGGPKIMVGGGGPRILEMAGANADIVSINLNNKAGTLAGDGIATATALGTKDKLAAIHRGIDKRDAGLRELEIEIPAYFTVVTDQADETVAAMAPMFGIEPEEMRTHPHVYIGSVDQICDTIEQRREEYGISYFSVGWDVARDFAPVVERLTGK